MGEDTDVMLSDHRWPRRSARPMSASRGSPRSATLQLCMLQASATSADPPILYGRIRPIADMSLSSSSQGHKFVFQRINQHFGASVGFCLASMPMVSEFVWILQYPIRSRLVCFSNWYVYSWQHLPQLGNSEGGVLFSPRLLRQHANCTTLVKAI